MIPQCGSIIEKISHFHMGYMCWRGLSCFTGIHCSHTGRNQFCHISLCFLLKLFQELWGLYRHSLRPDSGELEERALQLHQPDQPAQQVGQHLLHLDLISRSFRNRNDPEVGRPRTASVSRKGRVTRKGSKSEVVTFVTEAGENERYFMKLYKTSPI